MCREALAKSSAGPSVFLYVGLYVGLYAYLYKECAMFSIRLDKDLRSLSEFRARCAEYVGDVCMTGRPLLVTQRGRAVVIVMDVRDFEIMRRRLEELESLASPEGPADGAGLALRAKEEPADRRPHQR
jgi:prevent-host-death family protein